MTLDPRPNLVIRLSEFIEDSYQMLLSLGVLILARYGVVIGLKSKDEVTGEHVLEDTSQGPDVNPIGVRHVQQELRGLEPWRPTLAFALELEELVQLYCVVKVSDFDYAFVIPQDVRWLNVPVNNLFFLMKVTQTLSDLLKDTFDFSWFKLHAGFVVES
jgi:hypothetical protein